MRTTDQLSVLQDVSDRLLKLEHAADLIKTVLIVKEPGTVHAANAFEGLRKQVVAASGERRTHLSQLAAMAVAIERATSIDDLRPQVREWMTQAGVVPVWEVPPGARAQDVFEDLDGGTLEGATRLEVVEPAYVDSGTGTLLRLGRARAVVPSSAAASDEQAPGR